MKKTKVILTLVTVVILMASILTLSAMADTNGFEIAAKVVNVFEDNTVKVTSGDGTIVCLNGIPTIVAGDGDGHSYLYQAKTVDGTLDVYQKNDDGTFKKDADGNRISNIVRDSVTGQAVKGPKLVDVDVSYSHVYGGAVGKSVEDVYVEVHNGGSVYYLYAGCKNGNTGYNAQGEEVGLSEVRMFGGMLQKAFMGNTIGSDAEGVNTLCSKTVFLGVDGTINSLIMQGEKGIAGDEQKFLDGYYTRAGEEITYTDPDDGQTYTITGTWEDYNLDLEKSDYTEYYNKSNEYFNNSGNPDFMNTDYYVDQYDDHYTAYCLIGNVMPQYIYAGTGGTQTDIVYNRVYGNLYLRYSAYGVDYDAKLDRFVEDYNDYKGMEAIAISLYGGSATGAVYSDVRLDLEGVNISTDIYGAGTVKKGAQHFGHVYLNMYQEDLLNPRLTYGQLDDPDRENLTVNEDFYPRWSLASAWALDADEIMPQLAINRGYVTETKNPKDVRIHMLSSTDAAKLLSYYFTGTERFIPHDDSVQQTEGYKRIFDASDDAGKFVIRVIDPRLEANSGINRFTKTGGSRPGDCYLLTFPNGQTMAIDGASSSSSATLVREIDYYLKSLEKAGIGDGKTLDYVVLTHYHGDHTGAIIPFIENFDVNTVILEPFDFPLDNNSYYIKLMNAINVKNEQYAQVGKPPIEIIKPVRGDMLTIGEGDETVEMFFMNPGDGTYKGYSFEELVAEADRLGGAMSTGRENALSLAAKMTYKGQSFIWTGDMTRYAEHTLIQLYGEEFLDCDVLKFGHHGYEGSNIASWLNACDPEIALQNLVPLYNPTIAQNYCIENNTGGFAEEVYKDGMVGHIKVVLDGEKITSDTQLVPRGYERSTTKYKSLEATYETLAESILDKREALAVVADGAAAANGTEYLWQSYADYVDARLEELTMRGYLANATAELLEEYNEKITELTAFLDASVMTGGADTTPDVKIPGKLFTDVSEGDWWSDAVDFVAEENYFGGVSFNSFAPNGKMTRAMLVTVIGRMAKADVAEAQNVFTDVEAGSWYAGYVAWAAENGIVNGVGDNKFAPNDYVTREQMASILMRYTKYLKLTTEVDSTEKYDSMKDTASVSEYAAEAMKWATAYGVINGSNGKINPKGTASRAEVAQMIMNYCITFKI